jgi:hypothetical protein
MRTFAVALTLSLASLCWAKGNAVQCEQKCDVATKTCEQQCMDRFPKDKQTPCKHACTSMGPTCQAHCRGEK